LKIPVKTGIEILRKNRFTSFIRHSPLIRFLTKKGVRLPSKSEFELKRIKNEDILIIFVLKRRSKISGQDVEVKARDLSVFIAGKFLFAPDDGIMELERNIKSLLKKI
jgi:hypothetical protein